MSVQNLTPFSVVVVALLLSACQPEADDPPAPPRAARVVEAIPGQVPLKATGSGTIEARTSSSVGFLVSGRMLTRDVDIGDEVKPGEQIATIDPTDLNNQLDAAKADVVAAQASVDQAKPQEAAKRQLLKDGYTTQAEYDEALKSLQSAEASLTQAQANLRLAESQVQYATLVAPVAGVVTQTGAEPGNVVQAGQMVVEVAQDGQIEAVFSVPADIANRAKPGIEVAVSLQSDPSITTTGKVRQIAPSADAVTGTYTIRVSLPDPPPAMRLGAIVRGSVEVPGGDLVSLPTTALVQTGDEPQVWVVGADGAVHLTPVTVSRFDTDAVLVSGGLKKGDLVVIAGVNSLAEGQIVTPEKVASK